MTDLDAILAEDAAPPKTAVRRAAELASVLFQREGWTWGFVPTERIPTVDEIEECYLYLAAECQKSGSTGMSTGRLSVTRDVGGIHDTEYHLDLGGTYDDGTQDPA